jgi:hypothetical protein
MYDFCRECPKLRQLHNIKIFDVITKAVAGTLGVKVEDLRARGRERLDVCKARQVCAYLCREITGASLVSVGAYYGGVGHDGIIYRVGKINILMRKPDDECNAKEFRLKNNIKLLLIELRKQYEITECERHAKGIEYKATAVDADEGAENVYSWAEDDARESGWPGTLERQGVYPVYNTSDDD